MPLEELTEWFEADAPDDKHIVKSSPKRDSRLWLLTDVISVPEEIRDLKTD